MGQPLKYTVADYHEPSANAGRNVQGIVGPITVRPGLEASPMSGGAEALSPMPFEQAYHSKPLAPTGQELTFKLPATLNQGLNMGQVGGGRRKTRGGFYPSIMGGVVQNAPLLIPVAARQSLRLLEEYKLLSRKSRRNRHTRRNKRTRRNRKSTRRH